MKTSLQIANECMINVSTIRNLITRKGIRGEYDAKLQKMFYNKYQVDCIHYFLFIEYRIEFVIYESKMNEL